MRPTDFGAYGPGGYAGPSRLAHLSQYRLRPGDELLVFYLITRRQNQGEYRLAPGDTLLIESVADPDLARGTLDNGLEIQPDGTITVRLLGQVKAGGLTIGQLREVLEEQYKKFYDEPAIDVTPVRTNRLADDIRNAVGGQSGFNPASHQRHRHARRKAAAAGNRRNLCSGFFADRVEKGSQSTLQ